MAPDAPQRRPARPVADAPIDGLLARADEVAKGWALTLVAQAPLHEAPSILTEPLTRDGPRICDAALRALVDESDLRRLQPGGALRPLAARVGEMTGSASPADASRAVDALHDVLWSALRDELRAPDPDLVSELAQRLAHVCALIREAALGHGGGGGELASVSREPPGAVSPPPRRSPPPPPAPPPSEAPWRPPAAGEGGVAGEPAATAAPRAGECAQPSGVAEPSAGVAEPSAPAAPPGVAESSAGVAEPSAGVAEPSADAAESSPALWLSALADEVRQAVSDGAPLSLLLAELEDADRLILSTPDQADAALGAFTAAVRRVLRRQDILVRQSGARAWVIARETPRPGAHSLAARIAEAIGETMALAGAPLTASVGVAVLGEDGRLAEELIDAAEEARFAASARGIEVSRRVR